MDPYMNQCGACKRDFGSVSAFDRHQRWRGGELTCLDPVELDMHQDHRGRWRANGPSEDDRDWVQRTSRVRSGTGP